MYRLYEMTLNGHFSILSVQISLDTTFLGSIFKVCYIHDYIYAVMNCVLKRLLWSYTKKNVSAK